MDELFSLPPWNTLQIFIKLQEQFKQDDEPLPDYISAIAIGTAGYEQFIRDEWEKFKANPTKENAKKFIDVLIGYSTNYWPEYMADVLDVGRLTQAQLDQLQESLDEHHNYLSSSLLPDLLKAIDEELENFSKFDYRVIFLYAGALWSFGFLSTVAFDGLDVRDAADLFIFLGPNDENTCTGERGCQQHVNKIYTVAEIVTDQIIPGFFRCGKSCRHILLPVASPLG